MLKYFTANRLLVFIVFLQFWVPVNNIYASDELNRIKLFPENGSKVNPLILAFSGKSFGKNGVSLLRDSEVKSGEPIINFFRKMYGHIKNDRKIKYIEFWQNKYQPKMRKFYETNSKAWPRFVELLRSSLDYKLIKVINYGDYTIAQILNIQPNNKVYVSSVTLSQTKNKYSRTNDLKEDFVVSYFTQIDARKEVVNFKSRLSKKIK